MIVIGSNTSDNGKSRFIEDVSHFMELRQNRQIAKRSAENVGGGWFGLGLGTRGRLVPRPLSPETEPEEGLLGWGPGCWKRYVRGVLWEFWFGAVVD